MARAVRIIRSIFPPIDLFEDIADPADWPLLISAEQKTNPRLMETIGNLGSGAGGQACGRPWSHLFDGAVHPCERRSTEPISATARSVCFMRAIPSKSRCSRRFITMAGSWRALTSRPDGPRNFGRSCSTSTPNCMISEAAILPFKRRSTRTDMWKARTSACGCGLEAPMASSTRAFVAKAANASDSFIPTAPQIPFRGGDLDYHWDGARVDLYRDLGSGEVYRII